MGGTGGLVAFKAMERQERARQQALDERRARMNERLKGHKPPTTDTTLHSEAPAEALVCPRCQTRFAFGDACPDCAEPLVGSSFLHSLPPAPPPDIPAAAAQGPRYLCESCHRLSEQGGGICPSCQQGELLDRYSRKDRPLIDAIQARRVQRHRTRSAVVTVAMIGLIVATRGEHHALALLAGAITTLALCWLSPARKPVY